MTHSMTGFSALETSVENAQMTIELRAVNSRYLDLHFKLDDTVKTLEPAIRELIKTKVSRGKLECKISFAEQGEKNALIKVNDDALNNLFALSEQIRQKFPESEALTVAEILNWPTVITKTRKDKEVIKQATMTLVTEGLQALNVARQNEGEKLKAIILDRVEKIELLIEKVKPLMPSIIKAHQEKLEQKLQETMKTLDNERIAQELVLYAQRIDVDEELTRLTAHVSEIKTILTQNKPVGKRLDFMMQELNREANTLGSKSVSIDSTQVSMELKVLIEQMREQVQNIE